MSSAERTAEALAGETFEAASFREGVRPLHELGQKDLPAPEPKEQSEYPYQRHGQYQVQPWLQH